MLEAILKLTLNFYYLYIYHVCILCMSVRIHKLHGTYGVIEHLSDLSGIGFLLSSCGCWGQTQAVRLGGKCLHLQAITTAPNQCFTTFVNRLCSTVSKHTPTEGGRNIKMGEGMKRERREKKGDRGRERKGKEG